MKTNTSNMINATLPPDPWDNDAARLVVAALEKSGQSVPQFASTHGVSAYKIRRCQHLLHAASVANKDDKSSLLSVRVKETPALGQALDSQTFEIKTLAGLSLRFPQDICPTALVRIVRSLVEASC